MCAQNAGENIRNFRLNRTSFKTYLSKRYKSKIAETIVNCFDFSMPWDHINYFEGLEVFVNNSRDSLLRMVFQCLDFNGDGFISEVDLFILMKTLDGDIFVDVASKDVVELVKFLQQKLKEKGLDNPIENQMRRLEKELTIKKNIKYRQLLGVETAREDFPTEGIFKLSALEKMANIVEKTSHAEPHPSKIQKSAKNEDTNSEHPEVRKSKKFHVKDLSYEICENDESTMKCSLEEYLKFITTGKLPALLIDIFIYLGAERYVKYAIESPKKKNKKDLNADSLSQIEKRGKIRKQSTMAIDNELSKWRIQLGEEVVEDFCKAFAKISVNKLKPDNELTVDMDSIMNSFESIFGVKNEFLAKCIYFYLTDGYLDKDIRLPDFIEKFLCFGTGMKRDFYNFIFNFFDVNKDDQVTMIDLIFFYTYLPKNTQFGTEMAESIELFSKKFILSKGRRPGEINLEIFKKLFPELPCFVTEIMNKLFKKTQTIDMKSLNVVNGVRSALMIDPDLNAVKNPKLFYNLFDKNFTMNSYHVEKVKDQE